MLIKEISDGLYADDLMTGDENVEITTETKFLTTVQGHLIHYSQMALKYMYKT